MVAVQTLEVVQGPQILYIVTLQQKAQVWTLHFCNIFVYICVSVLLFGHGKFT
jgi:hypothetical protein